jgi:hypothetical protein
VTGDPGRAYAPANAKEIAIVEVPTTIDLESAHVKTTRILRL